MIALFTGLTFQSAPAVARVSGGQETLAAAHFQVGGLGRVLASWTEGLPRALVEAMADGLPCVATEVGGVGELLECHRMVPPRGSAELARAIAALLEDGDGWERTITRNLDTAARLFTHGDSSDALVEAVLEVAGVAP
jgi:glycosyltransferase involved in cell wall biosynthesis